MKMFFAILTTALMTFSSWGSSRAGNGGNVLLCHPQVTDNYLTNFWLAYENPEAVELLDYSGAGIISSDLDIHSGITAILDRLKLFDAIRAEKYRKRVETFFSDVEFSSFLSFNHSDVQDIYYGPREFAAPKKCSTILVAVQFYSEREGKSTFKLDHLFHRLDVLTRTGLVLHEIIYEAAIRERGVESSNDVRYFNWLISSDELNHLNQTQYDELVRNLNI